MGKLFNVARKNGIKDNFKKEPGLRKTLMERMLRIINNMGLLFIARLFRIVAGFVTIAILARYPDTIRIEYHSNTGGFKEQRKGHPLLSFGFTVAIRSYPLRLWLAWVNSLSD